MIVGIIFILGALVFLGALIYLIYVSWKERSNKKKRGELVTRNEQGGQGIYLDPRFKMLSDATRKTLLLDLKAIHTAWKIADLKAKASRSRW